MKIVLLNIKRNLHGWFNMILFVIPVIAMIGYIIIFNISSQNDLKVEKPFKDCRIGIIDQDNTKFTKDLIQYLDTKYFVQEISETERNQYLVKNKINYSLKLEKGITDKLINGEPIEIKTVSMSGGAMFTFLERDLNNQIRRSMTAGILTEGKQDFYQYLNGFTDNKYKLLIEKPKAVTEIDSVDTAVSTFWGFVIFFFIYYNCYFGNKLLEDRLNGKTVRIVNTKYSYGKYIFKLLLSQIILGGSQIAIMSVFMWLISDQNIVSKLLYIMSVLFLANTLGLVLGIFISVISKGKNMYLALLNILVNVLAMLGGLYWSVKLMPQYMIKIAKITPTYWIRNLMDEALEGVNIFATNSFFIVLIYICSIFILSLVANKLVGINFRKGS